MREMRKRFLVATAVLVLSVVSAQAETVEEFYRGKQLDLLIGASAGGGIDINGRLVARYMGKHVPGEPSFVPKNLAGGASVRVANLIYNVSKNDGSVIGTISRAVLTMPLMSVESVQLDPTKITWIGSVTNEESVCVSRAGAAVKNWNDLLGHTLIVGGSSPGSDTYTLPVMVRNIFGARFELVGGYPDGKQIQIALERREVDATCGSYSSLKTQMPAWIRDKQVNFLVLISDGPNAELPGVPTVFDLAKTDEVKAVLKIILAPQVAGRPFVAPPNLPADRKSALQSAFMATMKDTEFLADANKIGLEVTPASGKEIEDLVKDIYHSSPDVVAKVAKMVDKPLPIEDALQKP